MPNEKEYNGEDFEEKENWYKENYDEIKKTINVLENSGNVFQKINSMPTSIDELLKLRREQFDKAIKDIENSKEYKAAAANVPDSSYSDKGKSVDGKDFKLTPYRKYEYTYAPDGTLASKVSSQWDDMNMRWAIASRHDYTLNNDTYSIEYSHYNKQSDSFEQPVDKMVYSLQPYSDVHNISHYRRQDTSTPYQLISEIQVNEMPLLFADHRL